MEDGGQERTDAKKGVKSDEASLSVLTVSRIGLRDAYEGVRIFCKLRTNLPVNYSMAFGTAIE